MSIKNIYVGVHEHINTETETQFPYTCIDWNTDSQIDSETKSVRRRTAESSSIFHIFLSGIYIPWLGSSNSILSDWRFVISIDCVYSNRNLIFSIKLK